MKVSIKQLFLFPVKSLRGITLESAELTDQGFALDRHWMLVKPDGGFISQRQLPNMVLIHTAVSDNSLILSKSAMSDLHIPLEFNGQKETIKARVWKDHCQVWDEGIEASKWLTEALSSKHPLRLVRMADNCRRPQSKPELLGSDTHTLFADTAPYLICNQSSLDALNQSMQANNFAAISIENFRPNIVLGDIGAFTEHQIAHLESEHIKFTHCYPCQRCAIPTVNIETGQRHPQLQPFSLIADINSMPDNPKAPAFGENAILVNGQGEKIQLGDEFNVVLKR